MIRIALCDDEIEYLTLMENFIHEKLSLAAVEHVIEKFTNGEELLNSPYIDSYYAVFLDIVMPAISGLQVGSRIFYLNKNINIFFVSHHDELVYEAIRSRPVRFIRKKYIDREMSEAVDFLLEEIKKISRKMIFNSGKKQHEIEIKKIIYVESIGHYIMVVTTEEKIKVRAKISEYFDEMKENGFVQVQKGIVVNMLYITQMKRDKVFLQGEVSFPISRSRIEEVERLFMSFLRREVE